jgi:hypothetical protein
VKKFGRVQGCVWTVPPAGPQEIEQKCSNGNATQILIETNFRQKRCSVEMNDALETGDPARTRTPNPLLRRQVLYPVELRDRIAQLIAQIRGRVQVERRIITDPVLPELQRDPHRGGWLC